MSHAGVERLLTPEELERKTKAITGYVWGDSHLNAERSEDSRYELMYGGIDSDGIIVRAGDITPLMAAVAQRHAVEVSCPVVLREFYLLPDRDRRLFDGIDTTMSPVSVAAASAEITAASWSDRQTVSLPASLAAGAATVRLTFSNDFYDSDTNADRNLYLDAVVVRSSDGSAVERVELESLAQGENLRLQSPEGRRFCASLPGLAERAGADT